MRQYRRTRGGFTLVELLVVIAIMGVLAVLLFPALATAKTKAHGAVCKNNLRQIELNYTMTVEDSGGRFVPVSGTGFSLPQYLPTTSWIPDFWRSYWAQPDKGWICPLAPAAKVPSAPRLSGNEFLGSIAQGWGSRVTASEGDEEIGTVVILSTPDSTASQSNAGRE